MKVDQRHVVPGLTARLREEIYEHVFMNDEGEVGGVLVGEARPGKVAVVHGAIPALEAAGARASVTFTHDAWAKVHAVMEDRYPDLKIVGWYHSHPGFGIFLSGHDLFIQENFFSEQSSIAYVIDPHAGEEGIFGWRHGEIDLLYKGPTTWEATRGPVESASASGGRRHRVEESAVSGGPDIPRVGGLPPPPRRRFPLSPLVLLLLVGFIAGLGLVLVATTSNDEPSKADPADPAHKVQKGGPAKPRPTRTETRPTQTADQPKQDQQGSNPDERTSDDSGPVVEQEPPRGKQ